MKVLHSVCVFVDVKLQRGNVFSILTSLSAYMCVLCINHVRKYNGNNVLCLKAITAHRLTMSDAYS